MKNLSFIFTLLLLFLFTNLNINAQQKGTITDYDGNVYQTVVIGDQEWMAENFKVKHYSNGTEIPLIESFSAWGDLGWTEKAYCIYENNPSNFDTYGVLYTWTTAMDGAMSSDINPSGVQGICPEGWHLPSDAEWLELINYLGSNAGGKLKEAGTSHWQSPNEGASNESGFTALPGGCRYQDGNFDAIGTKGTWWTSTESNVVPAWRYSLHHISGSVMYGDIHKGAGLSVRCVKNSGTFINSIDMKRSIALYPNPANQKLNISAERYSIEEVSIYTLTGQQVLQVLTVNSIIDISALEPGMYIVEVTVENIRIRQKLLIE